MSISTKANSCINAETIATISATTAIKTTVTVTIVMRHVATKVSQVARSLDDEAHGDVLIEFVFIARLTRIIHLIGVLSIILAREVVRQDAGRRHRLLASWLA